VVLNTFIETLLAEKGYSKHTCRAYHSDISGFMKHLCDEKYDDATSYQNNFLNEIESIDKHSIRGYLSVLVKSGKSKRTIGRKLSAIKSFFDYLIKSDYIKLNPADMVAFPKLEKRIPHFLSIDDLFYLLDSIKTDTWLDKRNLAMFETFYSTGMRISELEGLNMDSIDFKNQMIKVFGKGSKERIVPVGKIGCLASESNDNFR